MAEQSKEHRHENGTHDDPRNRSFFRPQDLPFSRRQYKELILLLEQREARRFAHHEKGVAELEGHTPQI